MLRRPLRRRNRFRGRHHARLIVVPLLAICGCAGRAVVPEVSPATNAGQVGLVDIAIEPTHSVGDGLHAVLLVRRRHLVGDFLGHVGLVMFCQHGICPEHAGRVEHPLGDHALPFTHRAGFEPLAVFARDRNGVLVGGSTSLIAPSRSAR